MDWITAVTWMILGITFSLVWGQWKLARLTRGVLEKYELLLADAVTMHEALTRIATNTCCDRCQEAALVARRALGVLEDKLTARNGAK